MSYIPPGFTKGELPVPPNWSYDEWMDGGAEPMPQMTQFGPFEHADIRFWLRGSKNDPEVGFNIDDDSEADIWVAIADLEELEGDALDTIQATVDARL